MSLCTEIATRICEHWDRSDAAEYRGARAEVEGYFQALLKDTERLSRLPARDLRDVLAQLIVVAEASCTIVDEEQSDERLHMAAEALDRFIRSAAPVLEEATGDTRPSCLARYVDLHGDDHGDELSEDLHAAVEGERPEASGPDFHGPAGGAARH